MAKRSVDDIIRDAMAEGKFDNLEGKGKPLNLNPQDDLGSLALRMVKEAGFAPEWVELAKQIEAGMQGCKKMQEDYAARREKQLQSLEAMLAPQPERKRSWRRPATTPSPSVAEAVAQFNRDWERALAANCAELHRVNKMIDRFNRIVPMRGKQKMKVSVKEAAAEFVARFGKLSPLTDSARSLTFVEGGVDERLLQPPKEEATSMSKPRGRVQAEALEKYVKMRKLPTR
jgi:DnaJ family protein C protein 28